MDSFECVIICKAINEQLQTERADLRFEVNGSHLSFLSAPKGGTMLPGGQGSLQPVESTSQGDSPSGCYSLAVKGLCRQLTEVP